MALEWLPFAYFRVFALFLFRISFRGTYAFSVRFALFGLAWHVCRCAGVMAKPASQDVVPLCVVGNEARDVAWNPTPSRDVEPR